LRLKCRGHFARGRNNGASGPEILPHKRN
jgi:hypothetical protein